MSANNGKVYFAQLLCIPRLRVAYCTKSFRNAERMSNEDGTFLGAAQGSRLLHFFHLCTIIQSGELSGLPESIVATISSSL